MSASEEYRKHLFSCDECLPDEDRFCPEGLFLRGESYAEMRAKMFENPGEPSAEDRLYDVTITDGVRVEKHVGVTWKERNRLADFAFRHGYKQIVAGHVERVRGAGTYR